jgi:hypothetical protein
MSWQLWHGVRLLAAVAFLSLAATMSGSWLRLSIGTTLKGESIEIRSSYDVSAIESDLRILRQYVPAEGMVGYLSNKPDLERRRTQLRVAPLLLAREWRPYDIVLVDYPIQRGLDVFETRNYRLAANLTEAQSFARGLLVYMRVR